METQTAVQQYYRTEAEKRPGDRGVMAFPDIEKFYELLMARLHMVLGIILKEKFTIIVNALPRNHEEGTFLYADRFKNVPLKYVGIRKQRELLEGRKQDRVLELDQHWDLLEEEEMEVEQTKESSNLYTAFKAGNYSIKNIRPGNLSDYFTNIKFEHQKSEKAILERNLENIAEYKYISVPLIQFAEFDGVAHIIFHNKDFDQFKVIRESGKEELNYWIIRSIILSFSREYEDIILDWDIVGGNRYKETIVKSLLDKAENPALYKTLYTNPILKELDYQGYYLKHNKYFIERFKLSDAVPQAIMEQYRRNAILTILIDSYAHNISAHSLTALEWWFRQRANRRVEKFNPFNGESKNFQSIPLLTSEYSLDNEIHPLLRFLLDKGAFWTGLTRVNNFGGKVNTLFNVLWEYFINNPLYLGTIAFSEGILKLNINITLLKVLGLEQGVLYKKKVLFDGNLAKIDLSRMVNPDESLSMDLVSNLIIKGNQFEAIKNRLSSYKAYFPGGVVGRHSFFTILENEIRNIKHHSIEGIKYMQEEGLTLNISIEDTYANGQQSPYYKIGVWIKYPVRLDHELLVDRLESLKDDIITEKTHQPRLGGIFQDKICSAMLFNNTFTSVQDNKGPRGKRYYPWMKVVSSPNLNFKEGMEIEEIELTVRRYYDNKYIKSKNYFDNNYKPHEGYYKKIFHLWKGADIYHIKNLDQLTNENENISRFKFISIQKNDHLAFKKVREAGIIRVISGEMDEITDAYRMWLELWMNDKKSDDLKNIVFWTKPKNKAQFQRTSILKRESGIISYLGLIDQKEIELTNNDPHNQRLNLIHGGGKTIDASEKICRYRNHGSLMVYFTKGLGLAYAEMSEPLAAELFEVLATRICIFDNRIANRVQTINKEILKEELRCSIFPEQMEDWQREKENDFLRNHFLVIHLSFIEAFKNENGKKKYSEKDIGNFIENEILHGRPAPRNFILVITTGRGRTEWKNKLEENDQLYQKNKSSAWIPFSSFVIFRPVESLITAVENAIVLQDDIDLKFRLVKVLFGS